MFGANVALACGYVPQLGRHMAILEITPDTPNESRYRHNILMLDCSDSMRESIRSVITDACQFVTELDDTNYVSIVVFSGHGQAKLLTGPRQCRPEGREALQQAIQQGVHTMSTTVFSEPLELVLDHLRHYETDGIASQAVLFTDGCAVPTQWSLQTEESRAIAAAKALCDKGHSVSVIGYGSHYDEDFVTRLMAAGGSTGVFRHMSTVDDFSEIIHDIETSFAKLDLRDIKLTINPSAGVVTGIYRTLPEVLRLSEHQSLATRGFYNNSLTLYLDVTQGFDMAHIYGTINVSDATWAPDAKSLSKQQQIDCVQVIAAHLTITGLTMEAAELLTQIGKEVIAEGLIESYTQRDQRINRDRSRRTFRHRLFIGAGLKPSGPSHCILNVLAILAQDPSVIISLPDGAYKRGGPCKPDPLLVHSPLGRTLKVIGYTSHRYRFNFSFITQTDVRVLPVDASGSIVAGGAPSQTGVARTYNIIRDGELVMEEIYASMSEDTFMSLQAAGVIDAFETYKPNRSYVLVLGGMKMVSSAWARPNKLRLIETMQDIAELAAKRTALNAHINALNETEITEPNGSDYYDDTTTSSTTTEPESYVAECMELRLMNYKPQDYTTQARALTLKEAGTQVKQLRQDITRLRFRARCIAFACEATGWKPVRWGTPKPTHRGRFPKQEYTCTFGSQLVKRVTWEEEVDF